MQPFIVTFRFLTMPILHGACTLDAVLGGEIARGVDELEEAIRMTPLASTDGISHGSSLILLDDAGVTLPVPVVRKSRSAFSAIDPDRVSRGHRRVDRPWPGVRNLLNRYEARVCEGGAWLGAGRIDDVSELLGSIIGIGKRRQSGWGMIDPESLVLEEVDADPKTWGLVSGPDDPEFETERTTPRRHPAYRSEAHAAGRSVEAGGERASCASPARYRCRDRGIDRSARGLTHGRGAGGPGSRRADPERGRTVARPV